MSPISLLLFYMVSTHLLAEYAGPWRTVRSDLTWRAYEFESQDFAEYYLLGTLSSTLWAILVARAVLLVTGLN